MPPSGAPSGATQGAAATPSFGARLRAVQSADDSPPADLLAQLDHAANVMKQLEQQQIDVRFDVDHDTKTVHIKMTDHSGRVVREIPPRRLLDALTGGSGLTFDARA